jgi:hypothetical protein
MYGRIGKEYQHINEQFVRFIDSSNCFGPNARLATARTTCVSLVGGLNAENDGYSYRGFRIATCHAVTGR